MKVSIIIPVYNVALYIERCIKSVMDQTYNGDMECILVNDASSDDCIAIAEHLIADYNGPIQFRILNHEHNAGVSAARNTGIDAATGDYLYFMDSDDEITSDCIDKLSLPILKDPTIEMVEGCYVAFTKDFNNVTSEQIFSRPQLEYATHEAVRIFFLSRRYENKLAWNKLVNRDFVLKNQIYFKEGVLWEDFLWHFMYNKYLSHLYIIPDVTYKYHIRPKSIVTSTPNSYIQNSFGSMYAEIAKTLSPKEGVCEVRYILKGFCLFYLDNSTNPEYKQAANLFSKVLKDNRCVKEWFFLNLIVFLSRFKLAKKLIKKVGALLYKKQKRKEVVL